MDSKLGELFSNMIKGKLGKKSHCENCRKARKDFEKYETDDEGNYSSTLPGFGSAEKLEGIKPRLDLLLVAQGPSGRDKEKWKEKGKWGAHEIYADFRNYYLNKPLRAFHQQEMGKILKRLSDNGISWFFTDVVKCFVSTKKIKVNGETKKGKKNFEKARDKYCINYLMQQIKALEQTKIVAFGGYAYEGVNNALDKLDKKRLPEENKITFPTRYTADLWVSEGGVEGALRKISNIMRRSE